MAKYANVVDGAIYRIHDLTSAQHAALPAVKRNHILPYIEVARPAYNPETHHVPVRLADVIGPDDVTQAWAAPVALSAGELNGRKDNRTSVIADDPVLGKVLFRIANEALEGNGKPKLTAPQFRNFIKGLL